MSFQRETMTNELIDELFPLLDIHFKEISANQDIPLEVDRDAYLALEHTGAMRLFTAREESGEVIGYAAYFVRTNIHYKSSKQAVQDVLFIHPKKRGFGGKFIAWCDEQLKSEGVQVVYQHVKVKHNFGPLLERIGYHLVEFNYSRRLDK